MHNFDTHLLTFLPVTHVAQAYGEGSYGSGSYNETDSTTPTTDQTTLIQQQSTTPSPSGNTGTPIATDDQPATSSDESPRTTTQPATQHDTITESGMAAGTDPTWMIVIGASIVVAVLATVLTLIIKKLRN